MVDLDAVARASGLAVADVEAVFRHRDDLPASSRAVAAPAGPEPTATETLTLAHQGETLSLL
ncbi:hypothetical protein [Streptomyces sp. NPDC006193]|uniref:hypothetical protein n=1 Tax=Streptomyces sp. NPDC006193 TaxID=3155717 RepID=UPI0033BF9CC9